MRPTTRGVSIRLIVALLALAPAASAQVTEFDAFFPTGDTTDARMLSFGCTGTSTSFATSRHTLRVAARAARSASIAARMVFLKCSAAEA